MVKSSEDKHVCFLFFFKSISQIARDNAVNMNVGEEGEQVSEDKCRGEKRE